MLAKKFQTSRNEEASAKKEADRRFGAQTFRRQRRAQTSQSSTVSSKKRKRKLTESDSSAPLSPTRNTTSGARSGHGQPRGPTRVGSSGAAEALHNGHADARTNVTTCLIHVSDVSDGGSFSHYSHFHESSERLPIQLNSSPTCLHVPDHLPRRGWRCCWTGGWWRVAQPLHIAPSPWRIPLAVSHPP